MVIKVGDYVKTSRIIPGILSDLSIPRITNIDSIDIRDPGAKLVKCEVLYENPKNESFDEFTHNLIDDCIYPISENRYGILITIGEELLRILWWYHKRCSIYSWEEFTNLYYYNPIKVMRWVPIAKVIDPNIVEFRDGSIWQCKKIKYKSSSRSRRKKHHIYLPIKQLYGLSDMDRWRF